MDPHALTAADAGALLIADRLGVPAACLFADVGGRLRLVAAAGVEGGHDALGRVAETLADDLGVLDGTDAVAGAAFAAGSRLGADGALLVLAPEPRRPGAAWRQAYAVAATLARGIVRAGADRQRADLAAFFDGAAHGMALVRLDGADLAFESVNAAAAEALGAAPDALSGGLARDAVGAETAEALAEACRRAAETDARRRVEVEVAGADGPRALATTVAPVTGAAGRFALVLDDVTDRRSGWPAASQMPAALFVADADGRLTDGRGRALDALGLGLDDALGRPLADVFAGVPGARAALDAALAGRDGGWAMESSGRTFAVRVGPHRGRTGWPQGVVGVAVEDAGPAAAPVGVLDGLNRDIRSPLTSILGYAELLDEHAPPDEVREIRDVIVRSGERLLGTLDDLMDLRPPDGAAASHPEPTDLVALVASVAEASRPAAEARRVAFGVWSSLADEPLLLDPHLVERALHHLIGGAVASTEAGPVEVHLAPTPDAVVLTVTGGAPRDGVGADLTRQCVAAAGGVAEARGGDWTVRLPRHVVPVVDLGAAALPGRAE